MTLVIGILLLTLGFVLVFLELMIPSFGVIGFLSAGCFVAALILAFTHSVTAGAVFVGLICVGLPLVVWLWVRIFPRTALGRRMILQGPSEAALPGADGLQKFLGRRGRAKTQLRPAGIALFDGEPVDVVAEGKVLEPGCAVQVVEVSGNRVVVRPVTDGAGP